MNDNESESYKHRHGWQTREIEDDQKNSKFFMGSLMKRVRIDLGRDKKKIKTQMTFPPSRVAELIVPSGELQSHARVSGH